MKFSVGDPVRLKNSGEEGKIVAFLKKGMLEVDVNGTVFPVFADEVEHPYLHWFTTKPPRRKAALQEVPVQESKPERKTVGLHLSFVPQIEAVDGEDLVQSVKIFVLAEVDYAVRFTYEATLRGAALFELSTTLQPFASLHLHTLDLSTLNDQPRFGWRAQPVEGVKLGPVAEGVVRIKPPQLFAHISTVLSGGDPTFAFLLTNTFGVVEDVPLPELIITGLPGRSGEPATSKLSRPAPVIDLHASKLLPDAVHYTAGEILRIQVTAAETALDDAVAAGAQQLTLVHGVGSGALRDRVGKLLAASPFVEHISGDWHPRYGFGATVAHLRR